MPAKACASRENIGTTPKENLIFHANFSTIPSTMDIIKVDKGANCTLEELRSRIPRAIANKKPRSEEAIIIKYTWLMRTR